MSGYDISVVYRGTVQGGVVVLSSPGALPEGTPVEIRPRRTVKKRSGKPAAKPARKAGKVAKGESRAKNLPEFGSWSHRKDIGDTAEFVRQGRKAAPELLLGFGMWKDRDDWRGKSTLTIARELRRKAMGERYRG